METVLLITSDNVDRKRIVSAFQDIYEVIVVDNGEDGIAAAIEQRPSIIFTDIVMSGLSGYDVVLKLRQIDHLKKIPVIAMIAYYKIDDKDRARDFGFADYISKPVDIEHFRGLVSGYISGEAVREQKNIPDRTVSEYALDLIDRLQYSVEELRDERRFTESIVQSLSSGLMILDLDGSIITINPEGKRILSFFSDTIEGAKLSDLVGLEKAKAMTEIKKHVLFLRNEITLRAKAGHERTLGFTTTPRINTAGHMVGMVVIFRDITELQMVHKEMERINKLSTIGEIASAVAHEIRNPLAGIKTMAQSIDENLKEIDDNKEYITRIIKQVDRLNEILKGFFTFARPPKPRIVKTSLINIINEVKPLVKNRFREKRILLEDTYEEDLPDILADMNQIQQVFLNLILNAVDAVAENGRITINARSVSPSDRDLYSFRFPLLMERNGFLIVTLKDNGTGIPKDDIDKIFEPFFTTKSSGSGLGLSIVYRILQENNSAIFLESERGVGTTFIIFFETGGIWEKSLS